MEPSSELRCTTTRVMPLLVVTHMFCFLSSVMPQMLLLRNPCFSVM